MHGFTTIDLIILIVYLVAVLLAGILFSKKEMKGKEFFHGDGTIPWWVTSVSIFATLLSPISFLSLAGNSYSGTWLLWFAQLGMLIAIPLTMRFFLPVYSKLKIDTAYHYLELRFQSKALRATGAIIFIIYQIGRMSIIMYLPSMVLGQLTGISTNLLIILMGIIAIVYSYTGGLKSVLWTDFIQGMILLVGVVFALFFLIHGIHGGFGEIMHTLANGKFIGKSDVIFDPNLLKDSVFIILVGAGLNTWFSYVSSQDVAQRFTTTTNRHELNKMMVGNGILSIFIATVFYLIGTGLFIFYHQNPQLVETLKQDQIFASFIAYQLPVGITGLLFAAIYAAAQSTLSTGLNSVATSWTMDIQERFAKKPMSFEAQTKLARYISLGVGILSIIVSIIMANGQIQSAYVWFNGFMGLVLGVLGGTFALGVFTKCATARGAFVSLIASAIVIVAVKYGMSNVSIWSYSLISLIVSMVAGIIASKIDRRIHKDLPMPLPDTTIYKK